MSGHCRKAWPAKAMRPTLPVPLRRTKLAMATLARASRVGLMSATSIDFETSSAKTTSSVAPLCLVSSTPQRGPAKQATRRANAAARAASLVRRRAAEKPETSRPSSVAEAKPVSPLRRRCSVQRNARKSTRPAAAASTSRRGSSKCGSVVSMAQGARGRRTAQPISARRRRAARPTQMRRWLSKTTDSRKRTSVRSRRSISSYTRPSWA